MIWMALFACKTDLAPEETGIVLPPREELLGIGLAPRDPISRVGERIPFFATAYYDNTEYEDITTSVQWTSTDTRVASIGADGVAEALAEGETEIVVSGPDGKSTAVTLTVLGDEVSVTAVDINPGSVSIYAGENVQFSAVATYSDGNTGGLACGWATTDGGIVSIDDSALAVGQNAGVATISATCDGGFGGEAQVTVVEESVDLGEADLTIAFADGIGIDTDVLWLVEVVNGGDAYAPGFFVDAFLDPGGEPQSDDTYDGSTYIPGLSPGESAEVFVDMVGAPVGTFQSWVTVDFDQTVPESNESNNAQGPIEVMTSEASLGPDLVMVDAFAVTDGFLTEYLIEIRNDGDQTATNFWLDLYTDRPDAPGECEVGSRYIQVSELAPGASFVWDPIVNDASAGDPWMSWAYVDSCGDVTEADENNNQASFSPF